MPLTKTDYLKTVIYKIVCKDLNVKGVYVGHTTDFSSRKRQHKYDCSNINSKKNNLKVYQYINENGGWENFDMIEIEKYPCNDANEARAKERHYYEYFNANLNDKIPSRDNKMYYEDNKERIAEYKRKYALNNKEKLKEYKSNYYTSNKDVIKVKQKQYYEDNKEQILLQQKNYYEDNKEQILLQQKNYYEYNKNSKL